MVSDCRVEQRSLRFRRPRTSGGVFVCRKYTHLIYRVDRERLDREYCKYPTRIEKYEILVLYSRKKMRLTRVWAARESKYTATLDIQPST